MNKSLLLKVKAHILEEPRRIWMSTCLDMFVKPDTVVARGYEDGKLDWWKSRGTLTTIPACKTVGCIVGWTCSLSKRDAYIPTARDLLELDVDSGRLLFYVESWPEPYRSRYPRCRTAKQRAKCVADRIDAFIESEGKL